MSSNKQKSLSSELSALLRNTSTRNDYLAELGHFSSGASSTGGANLPGSQLYNSLVDPLTNPVIAGAGNTVDGQTTAGQVNQITYANEVLNGLMQQTMMGSGGGGGFLGSLGGIFGNLFGGGLLGGGLFGGFGLSSLIGGIADLFGGGSSAPPMLTPFQLPASVQFQGGIDGPGGGGLTAVDYGQNGMPRGVGGGQAAGAAAPRVTVQVNAMDSQSFLNRSDDIAAAVRQALLNSNSLHDAIQGI